MFSICLQQIFNGPITLQALQFKNNKFNVFNLIFIYSNINLVKLFIKNFTVHSSDFLKTESKKTKHFRNIKIEIHNISYS